MSRRLPWTCHIIMQSTLKTSFPMRVKMEDLRGRLWSPMACQSLTDANTYEIHRAQYVGTKEVLPNSAKNDCALNICSDTSFAMHPTTLWLWAGTTCPEKEIIPDEVWKSEPPPTKNTLPASLTLGMVTVAILLERFLHLGDSRPVWRENHSGIPKIPKNPKQIEVLLPANPHKINPSTLVRPIKSVRFINIKWSSAFIC